MGRSYAITLTPLACAASTKVTAAAELEPAGAARDAEAAAEAAADVAPPVPLFDDLLLQPAAASVAATAVVMMTALSGALVMDLSSERLSRKGGSSVVRVDHVVR